MHDDAPSDETMTTGQLARRAGVNVETIRYYERRGLLPEPPRTGNSRHHAGYRRYGPEDLKRIHFIRNAQRLGFTLNEIRELLELRVRTDVSCREVKERTTAKIADVRARIAELRRIERALTRISRRCSGDDSTLDHCLILTELDAEEAS